MQRIKKQISLLAAFCIITSIAFSMQPLGSGGGLKTKLSELRDKLIMLKNKLDGKPAGEIPRISLSVAINIGGNLKSVIENIQDELLQKLLQDKILNDPDMQTVSEKFAQYSLVFEKVPLLHLTLASLELTTIDKINDIKEILQTITTAQSPLKLELNTAKKPSLTGRFISCDIIESPELKAFVENLINQLKSKNINLKTKLDFKPHISILNIKVDKMKTLLKACTKVDRDFYKEVKKIAQENIENLRKDVTYKVKGMPKQQKTLFNQLSEMLNKLTPLPSASWHVDSFVAQQYAPDLKHLSIATFPLS